MSYENLKRIRYEDDNVFIPVCERCGRFVKVDIIIHSCYYSKPHATCKKCGRVKMVHIKK